MTGNSPCPLTCSSLGGGGSDFREVLLGLELLCRQSCGEDPTWAALCQSLVYSLIGQGSQFGFCFPFSPFDLELRQHVSPTWLPSACVFTGLRVTQSNV